MRVPLISSMCSSERGSLHRARVTKETLARIDGTITISIKPSASVMRLARNWLSVRVSCPRSRERPSRRRRR